MKMYKLSVDFEKNYHNKLLADCNEHNIKVLQHTEHDTHCNYIMQCAEVDMQRYFDPFELIDGQYDFFEVLEETETN